MCIGVLTPLLVLYPNGANWTGQNHWKEKDKPEIKLIQLFWPDQDLVSKKKLMSSNKKGFENFDWIVNWIIRLFRLQSGANREAEVQAEDEQAFLQRQLAALQAGAPAPRADSPLRATQRATSQVSVSIYFRQHIQPNRFNTATLLLYTFQDAFCHA